MRKPYRYWNKQNCLKHALKYKRKVNFKKNCGRAYETARRGGFLEEICSHMQQGRIIKWTEERCLKEALKYKIKKEFIEKRRSVYSTMSKKGWIQKACKHMIPLGGLYKRCIYAFEFPDNFVYVGLTGNHLRRKKEHLKKGSVYSHIRKTKLKPIFKILVKYIDYKKAIKKEGYWQRRYKREGWIPLYYSQNCGQLGGNIIKWTEEKIREESLKYFSKTEFIKKCEMAYRHAKKLGIFQDVTFHMKRPESLKKVPIIAIKEKAEEVFESVTQAANKLGIGRSTISNILKGRSQSTKGYKFKYA